MESHRNPHQRIYTTKIIGNEKGCTSIDGAASFYREAMKMLSSEILELYLQSLAGKEDPAFDGA